MLHILMFIRILTVYPLLTYFIRVQNFSGKFQKPLMPFRDPGTDRIFLGPGPVRSQVLKIFFYRFWSVDPWFHWSIFCIWLFLKLIKVFMNTEWPGYTKVFLVNLAIVAVGCSCAMFYDKVTIRPWTSRSFIQLLRLVILFVTLEAFVQWFICFSCHVESRWIVRNEFLC